MEVEASRPPKPACSCSCRSEAAGFSGEKTLARPGRLPASTGVMACIRGLLVGGSWVARFCDGGLGCFSSLSSDPRVGTGSTRFKVFGACTHESTFEHAASRSFSSCTGHDERWDCTAAAAYASQRRGINLGVGDHLCCRLFMLFT